MLAKPRPALDDFSFSRLRLGRNSFHVLVIRSWSERLDHLAKENRYIEALNLAAEFYTDHGKALVGLKGPRRKREKLVGQKLAGILLKFLDVSMSKNFPAEGNIVVLSEYFDGIVPPCVHASMTLQKKAEDDALLFENVWNTFSLDPFAKAKFLETLEVYILSDQLRRLPVHISQEFVTHFETVKRFEALEACITHLRIDSLDIHQVSSWLKVPESGLLNI